MAHMWIVEGRDGEEILPIIWEDNYFLPPGERREVTAKYDVRDLAGHSPLVHVDGWNIQPRSYPLIGR